jgi:hypothetical protein
MDSSDKFLHDCDIQQRLATDQDFDLVGSFMLTRSVYISPGECADVAGKRSDGATNWNHTGFTGVFYIQSSCA